MNTSQIELAANRGDIATADFQIGLVLRSQVIPAFLEDVGRIGWRTKCHSFTPTPGKQYESLPDDFFEVADVVMVGKTDPLDFIGEDPTLVTAAEANATAGAWTGYYLIRDPDNPTGWAIKFNAPAGAGSSSVVHVHYYWYIPFEDESRDVDLRLYLPEQYHWALVELLRREIIDDRFGQGDQRYGTANVKYQEWLKRITTKRALAPRGNRADYVR
jgi:hypothetical protein